MGIRERLETENRIIFARIREVSELRKTLRWVHGKLAAQLEMYDMTGSPSSLPTMEQLQVLRDELAKML